MQPAAILAAAADILEQWSAGHKSGAAPPLDMLVAKYCRNRRYIGSKDRVVIADITFTAMRHYGRWQWLQMHHPAAQTLSPIRGWLLYALCASGMVRVADIPGWFGASAYSLPPLSLAEQAFLAADKTDMLTHGSYPLCVECPPAVAESLQQQFGRQFREQLQALQQPAPVDMRVNTRYHQRAECLKNLQQQGITAEAITNTTAGIRLHKRLPRGAIPEAVLSYQDASSQMACEWLAVKPYERVLDMGAGAGGKALALAAAMQNCGELVLVDTAVSRLQEASRRCAQAGITIAQTVVADGRIYKAEPFDAIIVDAPCSGSGTWRRAPDARWRYQAVDIANFTALQSALLKQAMSLLKPAGRLLFATCSLLPEEGEVIVNAHPAPDGWRWQSRLLTPLNDGCDGFFMALLTPSVIP